MYRKVALSPSELQYIFDFWSSFLLNDFSTVSDHSRYGDLYFT